MTSEELQNAAIEARKAAEKAREFADLFDDYASCLLDPELQGRAAELHIVAGQKLAAIQQAVASSDAWVARR